MAIPIYFKQGESVKIKENGDFFTEEMSLSYDKCILIIAAYDSSGDVVDFSVGTAKVFQSSIDGQYFDEAANQIDLTTAGTSATYEPPYIFGPVKKAKLTLSSVDFVTDGIDHIKAFVWRA